MTIFEFLKDYLVQNGMFSEQANAVLEALKEHDSMQSMKGRWSEQKDSYPDSMMPILIVALRKVALEWIEENKPKAWYKAMFQD